MTDELRDPELDSLREAWHPVAPDAALRERVLGAYDCEVRRARRVRVSLAAAALIVIVAGAFAVRESGPRARMQQASVISRARPATAAVAASIQRAIREPVLTLPPRPPASPEPVETVTDFYPLIYAPPPLVHGMLLRVTVPAVTVQLVGIPVREDQLNEDAQADLLIGDDGTARAIRYLMLQGRIPAASMTIGPVVKDKPYSALGVTERFQTLADGNRIVQRTSSMRYRDREGRERRETAGLFPEPIAVISDPVSNESWILSPQNRTASRRPNAPQPPPAVPGSGSSTGIMVKGRPQDRGVLVGGTVSGSPAEHAGIANGDIVLAINGQAVKDSNDLIQRTVAIPVGRTVALTIIHQGKERTVNLTTRERAATYNASMSLTGEPEAENLGNQVIEGVTAQGRRTRQPVAAGAIGNERAFEVVNETWFSPDLRVMMMEKHSDPRSGDIVYRLTNVNRRDPDRSLFRVPKDYRVSPQLSPAFLPAAQ